MSESDKHREISIVLRGRNRDLPDLLGKEVTIDELADALKASGLTSFYCHQTDGIRSGDDFDATLELTGDVRSAT